MAERAGDTAERPRGILGVGRLSWHRTCSPPRMAEEVVMSTRWALESSANIAGDRLIERFIPQADHGARHETLVRAPADLVFDVAWNFDMQSHPLIRAIFRLREKILRAEPAPRAARGLVAETTSLGWGMLAHRPGRELVMGAVTRPWEANVVFTAIPPDQFAAFAEPGLVKIVWTLVAESLGPVLTRFRTETRVLATDEAARKQFRRYWRVFGLGIVLVRLLLLPRIRREAERRHRAGAPARAADVSAGR
jgi:hypothetical protein